MFELKQKIKIGKIIICGYKFLLQIIKNQLKTLILNLSKLSNYLILLLNLIKHLTHYYPHIFSIYLI